MPRDEEWMVLEIMGHTTIAGRVETVPFDGQRGFLRVHVPETPFHPAYVKDYAVEAVFARTPCSESVARRAAEVIARPSAGEHRAVAAVWDSHCLNDVSDPMAEVDLEAAREKDRELYGENLHDLPF